MSEWNINIFLIIFLERQKNIFLLLYIVGKFSMNYQMRNWDGVCLRIRRASSVVCFKKKIHTVYIKKRAELAIYHISKKKDISSIRHWGAVCPRCQQYYIETSYTNNKGALRSWCLIKSPILLVKLGTWQHKDIRVSGQVPMSPCLKCMICIKIGSQSCKWK